MTLQSILSPITPDDILHTLRNYAQGFYFDSAGMGTPSRYSYAGVDPTAVVTFHNDGTVSSTRPLEEQNIWHILQHQVYPPKSPDSIPFFTGGWVGFISYDYYAQHLNPRPSNYPWMTWYFYPSILITDNHTHKQWVSLTPTAWPTKQTMPWIRSTPRTVPHSIAAQWEGATLDKEAYIQGVERVKQHITAGDVYQLNLTRTFTWRLRSQPNADIDLYAHIREIKGSNMGGILHDRDAISIMSASPELLLAMDAAGQVSTRPIKGTRPRHSDAQIDNQLREELEKDPKERAELTMIVDLERNDLSQVCQTGSVKVIEPPAVHQLPYVYHLMATVTGHYQQNTILPLLKAMLPGGSITGAPKCSAMQLIAELEPKSRGLYTGAMGYIDVTGQMMFNILIRTFVMQNETLTLGVGSGITSDSSPLAEYYETQHKSQALLNAVNLRTGKGF